MADAGAAAAVLEALAAGDLAGADAAAGRLPPAGRAGVIEEAARALAAVARRPREAVRAADAAAALARGEGWAQRVRALALREAGRGGEAIGAAEAALRLAPEDPGARCSLARALAAAGRLEAARAAAEAALAVAPDDPVALRLAAALGLHLDPVRAEARLRESLRAEPRSAEARALLARALVRQGRVAEAEAASRAAAERDPALGRAEALRRGAILRFLQLGLGVFLAVVAVGFVPALVARRWPAAQAHATTLALAAAAILPVALLVHAAAGLRRLRALAPPDPEVAELARALLAGPASPGVAGPGPRA